MYLLSSVLQFIAMHVLMIMPLNLIACASLSFIVIITSQLIQAIIASQLHEWVHWIGIVTDAFRAFLGVHSIRGFAKKHR